MSVEGIEVVVPHDGGLQDVAAPPVQHEQGLVHLHGLVCRLEVESHQLGPAEPHGQRVVVRGVQSLASGVDPGQLETIVLQELLPLDLIDVFLCLGLGEGRHVPETGPFCTDLCRRRRRGEEDRRDLPVLVSVHQYYVRGMKSASSLQFSECMELLLSSSKGTGLQ